MDGVTKQRLINQASVTTCSGGFSLRCLVAQWLQRCVNFVNLLARLP